LNKQRIYRLWYAAGPYWHTFGGICPRGQHGANTRKTHIDVLMAFIKIMKLNWRKEKPSGSIACTRNHALYGVFIILFIKHVLGYGIPCDDLKAFTCYTQWCLGWLYRRNTWFSQNQAGRKRLFMVKFYIEHKSIEWNLKLA